MILKTNERHGLFFIPAITLIPGLNWKIRQNSISSPSAESLVGLIKNTCFKTINFKCKSDFNLFEPNSNWFVWK